MGWKDNRRRKRTWYRHYKSLAEGLRQILDRDNGSEMAAEAILKLYYDMYESRKLHGKRFIATSAYESMLLAVADTGLNLIGVTPRRYQRRPRLRGEPPPPPERPARTLPETTSAPAPTSAQLLTSDAIARAVDIGQSADRIVYFDRPDREDPLAGL